MIKLPHGYVIDADSTCYTLGKPMQAREKDKKTGETKVVTRLKPVGYYARLNQAILAYSDELDRDIVENADMGLTDALERIIESRESVKKLIREVLKDVV